MQSSLKWPDYLVLVSFLAISLAIGLYHSLTGGRQKTTKEFILADRRLQVLPTAISLVVSFMSAIMVLGFTAEMYSYGPQLLVIGGLGQIVAGIIIYRIIVPWLYPLKLVSINEYVSMRFGSNSVRLCTSLLGILSSVIYMGSSMYAPSAALESVTGFPVTLSIPLMSVVCIAYTALGGMRAVIWTDVFQFLTMVGGLVAVSIKGTIIDGGIGNAIKHLEEEGRMNLVDWSPDPTVRHTFWGLSIGNAFSWIYFYGLSQAAVQRFSATQSLSKARLTSLLTIPGVLLLVFLSAFTGFAVVGHYSEIKCDPLANKDIHNANQLLPYFVMTLFENVPGFAGLFLATLYGGALSSVSSALSGSAANCWEDVLKRIFTHLPESKKAIVNRILVLVCGVLAVSVAFLVSILPGPITQISISLSGSVAGPLCGIFLLGGISRIANWKGALTGGAVSLILNVWLQLGSISVPNKYPTLPPISAEGCNDHRNSTTVASVNGGNCTGSRQPLTTSIETLPGSEFRGLERFYCLSHMWYALFGLLTTLSVGMAISLIFRDKSLEDAVEDRLLMRFTNCGYRSQREKFDQPQQEKPNNVANGAVELIAPGKNIEKESSK